MANNDDWEDVPIKQSKASDDDWQDVPLGADHAAEAQAGLEHFGSGATMGYLPHLQSMSEPITDRIMNATTGKNIEPAPMMQSLGALPILWGGDTSDYVKARDENIARMNQQEKDHPTASMIGTLGGTAASALAGGAAIGRIPGMAKLATMAPVIAEGADAATLAARGSALAGRTASTAGSAGIQGAVSNPGDTKGVVDPLQLGDRATQGALGATIGAPIHLLGEGATQVGGYIANRLKDGAEKLAFRALGPFKRQVNQNRDEINDIGREALNSGIVRWTPGSAATIEERAKDAAESSGQDLGNLTDKLISMEGQASSSGMSRNQIADNLRGKLVTDNPAGIPGIDKRNQTFGNMIQEFEQDPKIKQIAASQGISYEDAEKMALRGGYQPKPLSFSDLRNAKMAVQGTKDQDGLINWNRLKNADVPIDEQFHRALASQLREGEESGAAAIEKAFGGGKTGELERLKDQYGNRQSAAEIAGNRADSQRSNLLLGLRDSVLASGGAAAGAGALGGAAGEFVDGHEGAIKGAKLGAAIGGLGSKFARDYGAQISSKTADSLSRLFQKSPVFETILRRNPTLIPQLIESIEKQNKN